MVTIFFDVFERSLCLFVGYKQAFSRGTLSGAVITFRYSKIGKSVIVFPDKPIRMSFAYHIVELSCCKQIKM